MEGDRGGAELDEVEVCVAPDQRVERPGDSVKTVAHRPGPLVLFQGEPDVAAAQPLLDAGDIAVQVHPEIVRAEESKGSADGLRARHRQGAVAVDVSEGADDLGGDDRLIAVGRPDLGEQTRHPMGTIGIGDWNDVDSR